MPKAKKTTKKATKKKATAKKKVVQKAKKTSQAKKTKVKKKVAVKKVAPKKKKPAKKTAKKAKPVAKKKAKKTTKAKTIKSKKSVSKKPATKKKAATAKTKTTLKPKKVGKSKKTSMTEQKIVSKIDKPATEKAIAPTPKEDKKLDTTMDELEIAPYKLTKNEDYMLDDQLEHFRKILLRWKHQLMEEVDSTVGHMQEDGLSFPDPVDRASQEEGFNLELRTRDRERKLIKKIEQALDGIETGDYGYCLDCGAEIGIRRLEARPTATKCIDCKTYEEIREKQNGA